MNTNTLPESGFLRLQQIVGDPEKNIPAIVPISRSSWYNGVKSGIYPKGIRHGLRTTVYRVEDIRALLDRISNGSTEVTA